MVIAIANVELRDFYEGGTRLYTWVEYASPKYAEKCGYWYDSDAMPTSGSTKAEP